MRSTIFAGDVGWPIAASCERVDVARPPRGAPPSNRTDVSRIRITRTQTEHGSARFRAFSNSRRGSVRPAWRDSAFNRWTRRPGRTSPGSSRSTTASGAAAGASPSTRRAPIRSRTPETEPSRQGAPSSRGPRPRRARLRGRALSSAGVSSDPPTSFRASRTSAPTSRRPASLRIGGSPASSSTRHAAGKGWPPVPWQERCSRSPASAGSTWRATPSPSRTGPSPRPSCTPGPWRCSSATGSSEPARSGRTAGS